MIASLTSVTTLALEAAVRAPSPFNTQPWRFDVDGDRIELRLDRRRVLDVADPDAREARLACGAALCNVRIQLRALDRVSLVDLMPDRDAPDLLAVVRVAGERPATDSERKLAAAIFKRHTNRHPFLDRPISVSARATMASAARAEGARLVFVDASERYDRLVDLIRKAEQRLDNDEAYRQEVRFWLGGPVDRDDGVPIDAIGPGPVDDQLVRLRGYYRTNPLPPRRFEQQPLLVAVLTTGTSPRYDVIAGAGMQRALLAACSLGLSASFLSQPFEVPDIRDDVTKVFGSDGQAHTLLRVGYGYPTGVTPRRPIGEVASAAVSGHANSTP
ncbi:Acg family FMN-binding oxidoreductase [Haloechinothrix halophila]|uniref:Acg family FMN-binding oxidoreductase n=1 Tax=Haloechinothrix halophila TaxID=1069073 RepID=UPI0004144625|nr:nitroreductase family protein [Haloechinothrix halophila]